MSAVELLSPAGVDRDLSRAELEQLACELAGLPELWREHVRHDPQRRQFAEVVSHPHVSAWLICWMHGHDTGFHDHDISAGAVAVLRGAVREQRLAIGPAPMDRVFESGSTFSFSAVDIHRVSHAGRAPAVTLHVYSPPLRRMGAYAIDDGGVLARHPKGHGEELRAA
jgi:predicted metal-dependent enzyme (double-stranded beta helix superfamily)